MKNIIFLLNVFGYRWLSMIIDYTQEIYRYEWLINQGLRIIMFIVIWISYLNGIILLSYCRLIYDILIGSPIDYYLLIIY